jgi:hypothetical protein
MIGEFSTSPTKTKVHIEPKLQGGCKDDCFC